MKMNLKRKVTRYILHLGMDNLIIPIYLTAFYLSMYLLYCRCTLRFEICTHRQMNFLICFIACLIPWFLILAFCLFSVIAVTLCRLLLKHHSILWLQLTPPHTALLFQIDWKDYYSCFNELLFPVCLCSSGGCLWLIWRVTVQSKWTSENGSCSGLSTLTSGAAVFPGCSTLRSFQSLWCRPEAPPQVGQQSHVHIVSWKM